ncbi:MAG: nucleotidyltransferase family protein [Candidatus Heimdallarchaeota archaeon]|nr:nucleotidyltransferase family protein [Candidatus Heimdallarchaeota archaeon]
MENRVEDIISLVKPILFSFDIKRASLFGSFVKGNATENSDVDIIVEFDNKKTLFDLIRLQMKMEEILKRKVDVITFNSLHPNIRDSILSEQVIIYG